ncbi:MAG: alpha/beta fold hydrolase [Betaproteobacteria bacterium]|nr:alpha/beta fold hydrolase [Betaproteobacteria bacterium]
MPYASNQGIRIHYRVEGSGPPLVLQHGFTWSMESWSRSGYLETLKPHYRLILVDARGHGASDKPREPAAYSLPLRVGDVVAVLDALAVGSANFWGYSMGGWIGWGMAKYAPERLHKLIIGGAHPFERRLPASDRLDGSDPKAFVESLFRRLGVDFAAIPPGKQAEFFDNNDFLALSASQLDRPPLEDILPTMRMPCFLYSGEADGVIAQMRECARLMPNATFAAFPGLNHFEAFHRADRVLPAVMNFLLGASDGRQLD